MRERRRRAATRGPGTKLALAPALVAMTALLVVACTEGPMRPILPRYLALSTPPSATVQSGVVFPAQPVIQLRDRSGRDVARAGFAVTAAIASGGGALGGTLTVETNGSGPAVFTDPTISGTVWARTR